MPSTPRLPAPSRAGPPPAMCRSFISRPTMCTTVGERPGARTMGRTFVRLRGDKLAGEREIQRGRTPDRAHILGLRGGGEKLPVHDRPARTGAQGIAHRRRPVRRANLGRADRRQVAGILSDGMGALGNFACAPVASSIWRHPAKRAGTVLPARSSRDSKPRRDACGRADRSDCTEDYPTKAQRPRNSRLDLARLQTIFGITPPPAECAVAGTRPAGEGIDHHQPG